MKVAFLSVTSWTTCGSIGAEHWYGRIHCGKEEVELKRRMSTVEAKALNKKDGLWGFSGGYRAGSLTERFPTKESVIEAAKETYKEHFPEAAILLLSSPGIVSAVPVIDAPDGLREKLVRLRKQMERCGGYEGDPEKAERIDDRWMKLMKKEAGEHWFYD